MQQILGAGKEKVMLLIDEIEEEVVDCLKSYEFATLRETLSQRIIEIPQAFSVVLEIVKENATEAGITNSELRTFLFSIEDFPDLDSIRDAFDGVFNDVLYEPSAQGGVILRNEKTIMDKLKPILAQVSNPDYFRFMTYEIARRLIASYDGKSASDLVSDLMEMGTALPKKTDKTKLRSTIEKNLDNDINDTVNSISYKYSKQDDSGNC